MENKNEQKNKSIPLRTIIIVVVVIDILISIGLLYFMFQTSESYNKLRIATQNYIDCQDAADELRSSNDDLTNLARSFVISENTSDVTKYYSEAETLGSGEELLINVSGNLSNERAMVQLDNALQLRQQLMVTEGYAMRLMLVALGEDVSNYPQQLQSIQLLPDDLKLSVDEQKEKARSFLFDNSYENYKNRIVTSINRALDMLMNSVLTEQVESQDQLLGVLHRQQLLTYALMITLMLQAVIIFTMVINPLQRQIARMGQEQKLSEEGTSEIQYLARTYNQMYDQNQRANEKLNYEATHDALTGLLNRAAYDTIRKEYDQNGEKIALVLFDVDNFKEINDTYGHDVGDKALKYVADSLSASFRKDDNICRIGGDEFAVIVFNVNASFKTLLQTKVRKLADKLSHPDDEGIPSITLSSGAAFSEQCGTSEALYKNADNALYQIKKSGRNGCAVVNESGEIEVIYQ